MPRPSIPSSLRNRSLLTLCLAVLGVRHASTPWCPRRSTRTWCVLHHPGLAAGPRATYVAIGLIGAFAGATVFTPLYSIDYRLPLIGLAGGYAVCVSIGGFLMRIAERRYAPASDRLRVVG